jgi:hypothetical protein
MQNAFRVCAQSQVPEAKLAYDFWELNMEELTLYVAEKQLPIDLALAEVYFEWLDITARKDLMVY